MTVAATHAAAPAALPTPLLPFRPLGLAGGAGKGTLYSATIILKGGAGWGDSPILSDPILNGGAGSGGWPRGVALWCHNHPK